VPAEDHGDVLIEVPLGFHDEGLGAIFYMNLLKYAYIMPNPPEYSFHKLNKVLRNTSFSRQLCTL